MPHIQEIIHYCNPSRSVETIPFPLLWCLYSPGTMVVGDASNPAWSRAYVVSSLTPPTRTVHEDGDSTYEGFELRYLALRVGLKEGLPSYFEALSRTIPPFYGHQKMADVSLVPLDLLEAHGELKQSLIARGRKYWNLRGRHLKEYVDHLQSTESFGVRLFSLLFFPTDYFGVPRITFSLKAINANNRDIGTRTHYGRYVNMLSSNVGGRHKNTFPCAVDSGASAFYPYPSSASSASYKSKIFLVE